MEKREHCKSRRLYFFMEKETKVINWDQIFFVHHRGVSAVKVLGFVSDRMSHIILRGHWCNIIVLNVLTSPNKKSDVLKDNFMKK